MTPNFGTDEHDACTHGRLSGCHCYATDFNPDVDDVDLYAYDDAARHYEYTPSEDPNVWVTSSGTSTRLSDMTDSHLANALGKQVHYHGLRHPRTKAMLDELTRRTYVPEHAPLLTTCSLQGNARIGNP